MFGFLRDLHSVVLFTGDGVLCVCVCVFADALRALGQVENNESFQDFK